MPELQYPHPSDGHNGHDRIHNDYVHGCAHAHDRPHGCVHGYESAIHVHVHENVRAHRNHIHNGCVLRWLRASTYLLLHNKTNTKTNWYVIFLSFLLVLYPIGGYLASKFLYIFNKKVSLPYFSF